MENQVKKTLIFLVILSSLLLAGCEQPLVPEPESIVISFEKNDIDATGTMVDQIVDSGVLVSINDNTFIMQYIYIISLIFFKSICSLEE